MEKSYNFVAHQDDDLLFMNPDILSDIQSGYEVWTIYLTAGQDNRGMEYANDRINGARAAYARMANVENNWIYEPLTFGGHELATNILEGTNIRLVFTFIKAASGSANDIQGDLYRMWFDENFVAQPIDGRETYTKVSFQNMISDLLQSGQPTYIRVQDNTLLHTVDHIDHISGSLLVSQANTVDNYVAFRRFDYIDYTIGNFEPNISADWVSEKTDAFREYIKFDPEASGWINTVMDKQYVREMNCPNSLWVARTDDYLV